MSAVVREVDWSPVYDLHATTVDEHTSSDVSFLYTAKVAQKSGEDWNNVNTAGIPTFLGGGKACERRARSNFFHAFHKIVSRALKVNFRTTFPDISPPRPGLPFSCVVLEEERHMTGCLSSAFPLPFPSLPIFPSPFPREVIKGS